MKSENQCSKLERPTVPTSSDARVVIKNNEKALFFPLNIEKKTVGKLYKNFIKPVNAFKEMY